MSRVGQRPVELPSGVSVELRGQDLTVKGKNGELSMTLMDEVVASCDDDRIVIKPRDDSEHARTMWGLQRSLVNNMVTGVNEGFTINLEITGVNVKADPWGTAASGSESPLTVELKMGAHQGGSPYGSVTAGVIGGMGCPEDDDMLDVGAGGKGIAGEATQEVRRIIECDNIFSKSGEDTTRK